MTQASMRTFVDRVKREQGAIHRSPLQQRRGKPKRSLIPPNEAGERAAKVVIEKFEKGLAKIK